MAIFLACKLSFVLLMIQEGSFQPMLPSEAEYFPWSNGEIAASGHRTCTQHARGLDDKAADCSYKHLTIVPQDLYTDIQNLDLSHNNLTTLKNGSFKRYPHLLEIDLSSTNLLYIETGNFYSLKNLRNLVLSNNYHACSPLLQGYLLEVSCFAKFETC